MFGFLKNQTQKSAEASALLFLEALSSWSNTYYKEGLGSWYQFGFKSDSEIKKCIDLTFKIIQIYEGCRMVNLVASDEYANFFGQRIGQELKKVEGLSNIFQHLAQTLNNNYTYAINPVTAISLWIANSVFQIKNPIDEQIKYLNFEVESVSLFTLKNLRHACQNFKFDDKLILKNNSYENLINGRNL